MNRPLRQRLRVPSATELEHLQVIERAYSDPQRLVGIVSTAADADEALTGIRREFSLSDELACTVTDQQLLTFTGARLTDIRARIAAILAGELGAQEPPPSAGDVSDWVEILLYGPAEGQSRIGWSGTSATFETSCIPMLDAAIRELTNVRNRLADAEAAES